MSGLSQRTGPMKYLYMLAVRDVASAITLTCDPLQVVLVPLANHPLPSSGNPLNIIYQCATTATYPLRYTATYCLLYFPRPPQGSVLTEVVDLFPLTNTRLRFYSLYLAASAEQTYCALLMIQVITSV